VGTVGVILFCPALFALDPSDYEKEEISALKQRDSYLQEMGAKRDCNKTTASSATAS
jgi:hypothetical protein